MKYGVPATVRISPTRQGEPTKMVFFLLCPTGQGPGKLELWGESSHGYHGFTTEIKVDKELNLESFSKPLLATHTKLITGLSLIFGIFGIYAFLRSRRKQNKGDQSGR